MAPGMTRHAPTRWSLPIFLMAGLCCFSFPLQAGAQTAQETAQARSLFEEGVSLADRADWQGAADRFERAYALKPTSGIAFNYASALVELGRLVEASELLRTVTRDASASEDLRRHSEEMLTSLQPRLAYLTVHLQDDPGSEARVDLDDREWPRAGWGVASPVDPGAHTVRCVVGGVERAHEDVTLAEGERRELELKLSLPLDSPAGLPGPIVEGGPLAPGHGNLDPSDTAHRPVYKRWWFWTGVGLVVAGGVVAGVLVATSHDGGTTPPVQGNTDPKVLRW
jgi:hypothetical protein